MGKKTGNRARTVILISIIAILTISGIIIRSSYQDLHDTLEMNGLKNDFIEYKIDSKESMTIGNQKEQDIYAKGKYIVKTKIITMALNESYKYIESRGYMLSSLYSKYTTPYPGPMTNLLECNDEYIPKMDSSDDGKRIEYSLYANERFIFGDCDPDTIKYESRIYLIYCKDSNALFDIEIFSELGKRIENITISCKRQ